MPLSMTPIQPNFGHRTDRTSTRDSGRLNSQIGVAASTALGISAALATIAKRQGFSLNPAKIAKTPPKDWAIFKIRNSKNPDAKVLKLEAFEIFAIGASSVAGGLVGGYFFDKKENFSAKCSEAVSQLLGDISIPLAFVAGPTALYKKFEDLATTATKHTKLQSAAKFINNNKILRVLCPTLVSGISLVTGIIAGNRVSNALNAKVHGEKQDRGIRITDFAPHLDDVCLAITLMKEKSPIGDIISKFVPIALSVAGIETGMAHKKHNHNKGTKNNM